MQLSKYPSANKKNNQRRKQPPARSTVVTRRTTTRRISGPTVSSTTAMARYLRCIVDAGHASTGIPDGDPRPSIVRNQRSAVVLKPTSGGDLRFFVIMNPQGTIQVVTGGPGTAQYYTVTGSSISVSNTQNVSRIVGPKLTVSDPSPASAVDPEARIVNAVHSISFSGPSLADGGTVSVHQADSLPGRELTVVPQERTARSGNITTNTVTPVLVGPAKRGFSLLHLPVNTGYRVSSLLQATANGIPGSTYNAGPNYGRTQFLDRVYVVDYAGLDPAASITIDCKVCIQELVPASSDLMPFAKPSEKVAGTVLQDFLGTSGSGKLYDWGMDVASKVVRRAGGVIANHILDSIK